MEDGLSGDEGQQNVSVVYVVKDIENMYHVGIFSNDGSNITLYKPLLLSIDDETGNVNLISPEYGLCDKQGVLTIHVDNVIKVFTPHKNIFDGYVNYIEREEEQQEERQIMIMDNPVGSVC